MRAKEKSREQTKLGRPALGIKIVLKLKALATPAAIANAHTIEASRKSRGTLYLSRPNRDCAGVNMNGIAFAETMSIVMRLLVCGPSARSM
ncbi:MAG: hypothetical protein WA624_01170 [Methylocella sp.]